MTDKAMTIVRRITKLERRTIYRPSTAADRCIARLWRAFSAEVAR